MSKSILQQTLASAQKKRTNQHLDNVRNQILDIMKKEFESRMRNCNYWQAIGKDNYLRFTYSLSSFVPSDVITVCEALGFIVKLDILGCQTLEYCLSVPEWTKGQKKSPAQSMIYNLNAIITKTIKFRKEQAKAVAQEAFEQIKLENFKSSKIDQNTYEIRIKVSYSDNNEVFLDKIRKIFKKNNFYFKDFDFSNNILILEIKEK